MNFEFASALDESQKTQAAGQIIDVFPAYYDSFGLSRSELVRLVTEQFHGPSEVDTWVVALALNQVIGLICFFPVSEMAQRALLSAKTLLSVAPDRTLALRRLQAFAFAKISEPGLYLSRVYVHPEYRGSQLATALLAQVIERALELDCPKLFLHVEAHNARAVAFYKKSGFSAAAGQDYLLMEKNLHSPS